MHVRRAPRSRDRRVLRCPAVLTSRRPSRTTPPPTPVDTTMPMKSRLTLAAPTHPSPRANALASLSTYVGRPVSSATRRRRGKPRHPVMLSGDTSSPPGSSVPHSPRRRPPGGPPARPGPASRRPSGQTGPEFLARRRRSGRRPLGPLLQHPGLVDQAAGQLGTPDVHGQRQICHETRDYGAHAEAARTRPRTRKSPAGKGGATHSPVGSFLPAVEARAEPVTGIAYRALDAGRRRPVPIGLPILGPPVCRATPPCPCDAGCARTRRPRRT